MNIAQVYIKKIEYDDALEYISRTLYLDPCHVKALSRKAFIHSERGEIDMALEAGERALHIEKDNKELLIQVDELKLAASTLAEASRIKILCST